MDRLDCREEARRPGTWPTLAAAALLAAVVFTGEAWAASIKLNAFWIDGVEIIGISEGQIAYTTASGAQNRAELAKIEGIRLEEVPQLEAGLAATEKGDHATAVRQYTAALRSADQPWLQTYVRWQLMQAQDRAGELDDAVNTLLALARAGADPYFLSTPPLASIAAADEKTRRDTAARLQRGLGGVRGANREALESYLAKLQATLEGETVEAVRAAVEQATAAPGTGPRASDPELVMPARIDPQDPVTQLLLGGKYQEALELVNRGLAASSANMSLRLYQKGLAQMGLARQQNENLDLYKDAGLSFMRLLIHQNRTITDYHGAAMLEVALVHEKIGRPDKAAELYQRASLMIDLENEPGLSARLAKLTGTDEGAAEAEPETAAESP